MSKYPKLNDGELFRVDLDETDLRFACCDCGKVHYWQFHHVKDNIWDFAVFSDRRATGQLRRHNFGSLQMGSQVQLRENKKEINYEISNEEKSKGINAR